MDMSFSKKVVIMVKLKQKEHGIKRAIKQVEKKNAKAFDDNLIVRRNHQKFYSQKKTLCTELAATLMAQATVLGVEL